MPDKPDKHRIDRTAFSIIDLGDDSGDKEYWRSRTIEERLENLDYLRKMYFGTRTKQRLQRFFEIAEFPPG